METICPRSQCIWSRCLQQHRHGLRKHHLKNNYGYRYITPSSTAIGLDSFYGSDRSFCMGMLFDETDFIIEFKPIKFHASKIEHHQSSYHGRLDRDNTEIIAVYFRASPMDYTKRDFLCHLRDLYQHVPEGTLFYQYRSNEESLDTSMVKIQSIWGKP